MPKKKSETKREIMEELSDLDKFTHSKLKKLKDFIYEVLES